MKLKRSLLCLLTAACLLLAAAAPALAEGTENVDSADPSAIPEYKMDLVSQCENIAYFRDIVPVENIRASRGDLVADQYAGVINYFYDTGDIGALGRIYSILFSPNATIGTDLVSYVPGSASPASAAPVTEAPFPDVPTDAWYAKAVSEMKDSGIIEGCDDGLFHPERPVTIGEFYAMLVRAITSTRIDATVATGVSNDTHWANGVMENARRAYLWPPENEHVDDYVLRGEAVARTERAYRYAVKSKYAKDFQALWTWTMARERTEGNMTLADIPDHATVEQYLLNEAPPIRKAGKS